MRSLSAQTSFLCKRCFSTTGRRLEILPLEATPDRIQPRYQETPGNDLLTLQWPSPPRNILLVQKENSPKATDALIEFAKHIATTSPSIRILLEPTAAAQLHSLLPFPIHTTTSGKSRSTNNSSSASLISNALIASKTDLITTFGGDGTILHASSLFSSSASVPPILSFSLGTLGFLSEWRFQEYKRAWREVYMSGSSTSRSGVLSNKNPTNPAWESSLGASQNPSRSSRILLRNRLRVSLSPTSSSATTTTTSSSSSPPTPSSSQPPPSNPHPTPHSLFALNELLLHRGPSPHLVHLTISLNARPLTTGIADGLIISTPTGSTAYSLSAGGSIVHPLVKGVVVTPVCARSLSFRSLVLPETGRIGVRVEEGTRVLGGEEREGEMGGKGGKGRRGQAVDVSVDGVKIPGGLGVGGEVEVWGEGVGRRGEFGQKEGDGGNEGVGEGNERDWVGGVPCVMPWQQGGDEGWVGGLNGLLKFNYPFGEEG